MLASGIRKGRTSCGSHAVGLMVSRSSRDVLYGLHAILRLHTVQEDETYLSLGDTTAGAPA